MGRRRLTVWLAAIATFGILLFPQIKTFATGTIYYPPTGTWNGYQVYLSPSNQSGNIGCDGYVESTGATAIAVEAKNRLTSYGYQVMIGNSDPATNKDESNSWSSSVHVAIHSNAGVSDCQGSNPVHGGTWLEYADDADHAVGNYLLSALRSYSPGTNDKIGQDTDLSGFTVLELRSTNMPAGYVETAFHTYGPDEDWLRQSSTVGGLIAQGVDNYFGNPRCPSPGTICPERAIEPVVSAVDSTDTPVLDLANAKEFPALKNALLDLFDGPAFGGRTKGMVRGATIVDNIAIVDLGDVSSAIPNGSTSAGRAQLFAQLGSAVFSFSNVNAVVFQIDGSCETFAAWLETTCDPITRAQWEAFKAAHP